MEKKVILIALIIAVAILAGYFTFFYAKNCSDAACFNSALVKCSKAKFINDAKDASWLYNIKGKIKGECRVDAKLLQLKEGTNEMAGLENKEMRCYLQLGVITSPQGNLANCHGLLKEEMQGLVINKLHNYIVDNLGQISEELTKAI